MIDDQGAMGLSVGVLGSILAAGLLSGIRGEIDQANVALVLVLVVVLAAYTGGRMAGAGTGVAAAASFDFFHTQPYNSLTIKSSDDIVTTALLLVIGLAVGQIATSRHHAKEASRAGSREVAALHRVAELSAGGAGVTEVTAAVTAEVASIMHLRDCRFVSAEPDLPHLEVTGRVRAPYVFQGNAFALPPSGVAIEVRSGTATIGWLACTPAEETVGVSRDRRRTAIALADHLGLTMAAQAGTDAG